MLTPILAAALVAAAVSLIGTLVNLRISRDARRAAIEQAKIAAALDEWREAVSRLRKYTSDIERLRASTLLIEMSLGRYAVLPKQSAEQVRERVRQFEAEFLEFFRSWADVKPEVADPYLEIVRGVRHDCKNAAHDVLAELKCLGEAYEQSSDVVTAERNAVEALKRFADRAEKLYGLVNRLKSDKFEEILQIGYLPFDPKVSSDRPSYDLLK